DQDALGTLPFLDGIGDLPPGGRGMRGIGEDALGLGLDLQQGDQAACADVVQPLAQGVDPLARVRAAGYPAVPQVGGASGPPDIGDVLLGAGQAVCGGVVPHDGFGAVAGELDVTLDTVGTPRLLVVETAGMVGL